MFRDVMTMVMLKILSSFLLLLTSFLALFGRTFTVTGQQYISYIISCLLLSTEGRAETDYFGVCDQESN